jgi:hypothetical protein
MGTCVGCGVAISVSETLYTADGSAVCQRCSDKQPTPREAPSRSSAVILIGVGAAMALLPFSISSSTSSYEMVNGEIVASTYRDWFAILGGITGAACALIAVAMGLRQRAWALAGGAVLVAALGSYQVARGFGAFYKPDGGESSGVRVTITPSEPPPSAPGVGPRAGEDALVKLQHEIEAGDGWKTSVLKVVAVAGAPNIVGDEMHLDWFAVGKDSCSVLEMYPEGAFVKNSQITEYGDAAEEYKPCREAATKRAKLPALADPTVDVDPPAREILAAWRDGKFQKIYDDAHPDLRSSVAGPEALARVAELFVPVAGKLVEIGSPWTHDMKHFSHRVSGPVKFDKGTLKFTLAFALSDGVPRLVHFNLELPPELQAHPDNADGETLARRALDALVAGRLDVAISSDLARDMRTKPTLMPELQKIVRDLGKVRSIAFLKANDCGDRRCVYYDLVGTKGKTAAEVVVAFDLSRWEVVGFTFDPVH